MNKGFEPTTNEVEEQWAAYSRRAVSFTSSEISKQLIQCGVDAYLGGNDSSFSESAFIQSTSFNIRFREKTYGCELWVYLWKKNKDSDLFLALWQTMINKGDLVWGGKYKKELKVENQKDEALTAKNKEDPKIATSQNDNEQDKSNNEIGAIKDKYAYLWLRREFSRMKDYNLTRFLEENDAPSWLSSKALNRHMKLMYEKKEIEKRGRFYVIKK